MPESRTLREWLADAPPHHFSRKRAWRALIQVNRMRKRVRDARVRIGGQVDLQRMLDHEPYAIPSDEDLCSVKRGLKLLVATGTLSNDERMDIARDVDQAMGRLAPRVVRGPVSIRVEGWPPGLGEKMRRRLLGTEVLPPGPYSPQEAARVVSKLDGLCLAGSRIRASAQLGANEVLPTLPRAQRWDQGRRERPGVWLTHLDKQATLSLTPHAIAKRQATIVAGRPVLDAMAGAGGNTIAFAMAGSRVIGVELDAARATLARRNIMDAKVGALVSFIVGDASTEIVDLQGIIDPDTVLFLDPPWLNESGQLRLSWAELVGPSLRPHVARWRGMVMLKLPASFDVETLPAMETPWTVRYEFGDPRRGDGHVVKMLTAWAQNVSDSEV